MENQFLSLAQKQVRSVTILAFEQSLAMGVAMSQDIFFSASLALKKKRGIDGSSPVDRVEVVTQNGEKVRTFNGSVIHPDRSIAAVKQTDLIVVAGFWGEVDPFLKHHKPAIAWLKQQHERGAIIGCLSSGTFLLAETGLLNGRVGTVFWRMADEFRSRYPKVILQPERAVTAAGNLFCSAGVASGCNLSIYLIERIWGLDIAQKVSKNFLMDIHPEQSVSKLVFDGQKYHKDQQVLEAQNWIEANFSANFLIEEVAHKFGMSLRNFARRFKSATGDTPVQYLQRIRVEVAKDLLKNDSLSIEQISFRVGYEDVSFFCRIFRRLTSFPPSSFREGFRS